jgi:hypothetical protein
VSHARKKNDPMERDYLILKRASASRPSGDWNDDDYDVLADGVVVGRIMRALAAPVGTAWMWTLGIESFLSRSLGRPLAAPIGSRGGQFQPVVGNEASYTIKGKRLTNRTRNP